MAFLLFSFSTAAPAFLYDHDDFYRWSIESIYDYPYYTGRMDVGSPFAWMPHVPSHRRRVSESAWEAAAVLELLLCLHGAREYRRRTRQRVLAWQDMVDALERKAVPAQSMMALKEDATVAEVVEEFEQQTELSDAAEQSDHMAETQVDGGSKDSKPDAKDKAELALDDEADGSDLEWEIV